MPNTTREIWWHTALELFVAIAATLIFHIAPAFLATKPIRIPTAIAIWLALGYTERLLVATRQGNVPWFCLAIILILTITHRTFARIFTVAALTLSSALLTWAVATTWHGHSSQNPHYSAPPDQLDGLIIRGMLVSAAPAVLAPTQVIIWKSGIVGICLPMLISVTAASLAAQAGATLHWRPANTIVTELAVPSYQLWALTIFGPSPSQF
ncbi:MAG: hypothetical protein JST93_17320 [Acidobacteria bacterium]|nr:hypothetical protein [Acidobacteriota bacterium]